VVKLPAELNGILILKSSQVLSIVSMLSESSSLFYRPKAKKIEADNMHKNFVRPGGDHFTLLNVWK
jgi:pre-mRNA-splicing factor ATP-dependent RNA helicase DHX16